MKKIIVLVMALITMLSISVSPVLAAPSPTAPIVYDVVLDKDIADLGICTVTPSKVEAGDTVTAVITDPKKYGFQGWEIIGDYEIIKGDLNSSEVVFKANSDIVVNAILSNAPTAPVKPTGQPSTSPESPQTSPLGSTNQIVVGALFIVLAGCAVALIKVKKRS